MAELKVFVSSTCYDLSLLRSQLRMFIKNLGYIPVMSDYEDVLYDPRIHTHTSCVDEVKNCDVLVLIIGGRFGGKATVEALNRIDFEALKNESTDIESLKEKEGLSITQLEVLTAIENSIPIYTFIENDVWHDHRVFEANKSNGNIESIEFPSIDKQKTAKYIFGFINFVRHRTRNNSIFTFEKGQDVEEILKKQWSSYFQRLLREQRYADGERKRYDALSKGFEELKAAFLTTINDVDQREIARGTLKYRELFEYLLAFNRLEFDYIVETQDNWEKMLKKASIKQFCVVDPRSRMLDRQFVPDIDKAFPAHLRTRAFIVKNDNDVYEVARRLSESALEELKHDWISFIKMNKNSRRFIGEVLLDIAEPVRMVRINDNFFENFPQYSFTIA